MKKIFLLAVLISTALFSNAQELGVRFGEVSFGNAAIDGVFALGEFNRVHADVSFGHGGLGVDALWDFLYKPFNVEGLSWYAGVGGFVWIDDPFWLGAVGELGIEYKFKDVPIVLGADIRPTFSIIEETNFYIDRFGFNARYVFGK